MKVLRQRPVFSVLFFAALAFSLCALTAAAGTVTITNINPSSDDINGGAAISITGTGFTTGSTTVSFGGQAAVNVKVSGATALTLTAPAHAAGTVDVVVTSTNGTATSPNAFTFAASNVGGGVTNPGQPGQFRFLTSSTTLPGTSSTAPAATVGVDYDATLLVANQKETVTFEIQAGRLPAGLTLNPATGQITGRPTQVESQTLVFFANDTFESVSFRTTLTVTARPASGLGTVAFSSPFSLPEGRVSKAYTTDISVLSGVGPFIFGAIEVPAGLTFTGIEDKDRTVTLSGVPREPGTFYMNITCTDVGDNNFKINITVPLTILPAGSDFRFIPPILANGEVNAPYNYKVKTTHLTKVILSSPNLPPGLAIDVASSTIAGTPTKAGTFLVRVYAFNETDTITLIRPIVVVPLGTQFFFSFPGSLPAATLFVEYGRNNPAIKLQTANPAPGATLTYAASGLPNGLIYNASSGVLSGVPAETGIYTTTFTATDSATSNVIAMDYDLVVSPPNGGDINSLPMNMWVKKLNLKLGPLGADGKESWQAQYIFNSDRTSSRLFTPAETLLVKLANIPEFNLKLGNAESLTGTSPKFSFKTPSRAKPSRAVKLDLSAMTLSLIAKNEFIFDYIPAVLKHQLTLGKQGYTLNLKVDTRGGFSPMNGYRNPAFVVASAKAKVSSSGKDVLTFSMLMSDPNLAVTTNGNITLTSNGNPGVDFRVISSNGNTVIFKSFVVPAKITAAGAALKLRSNKDTATPQGLFSYDNKTGKMLVTIKGATLVGTLTAPEEHVMVIVNIGTKQYFTRVTLFAEKSGSYSTKMP